MIKVNGLNKYYNKGRSNELHVINNTTLELPDTGLICILGESGSGKTTLMNTISGLDNFEGGIIDVDGVVVKKYGDKNQERVRNEKFGYIFQNYYLLQDRTVEYNLMLSLGLYNISEEEKEERIDYVLKAVDMWRYRKRLVSQLSGGQQQRIAIARALAKSPRVIFADEPTGNLDEANTMRTMSVLKKISKECLVVVVTHEKSIADFFADRIIWIADGQIQEDKVKTGSSSYQFVEDTNIYLGEYQKSEAEVKNINIEVYDNGEIPEIGLKLICENGKVYISIGDAKNVEILTSESEKKVLEGEKPVVEITDVEDIEYTLEPLEYAKKPKLSFGEIKDIAISNIKAMGKKQVFLVLALFAMSVMMVLAVQDIMTIIGVNEEDVVTTDSHYLEMIVEKDSLVSEKEFMQLKQKLVQAIKDESGIYNDVVMNPEATLSYTYTGFTQLENVKTSITDYTFVPLEKLNPEDIIYGEMPKRDDEIVVDRWVLEKYVENSKELSNVISNIKHFLGKKITAQNGVELLIVGISESEEMDIYIKKEKISTLTKHTSTFLTFTEFVTGLDTDYEGELGYNEEAKNYEALVSYADFMASYNIYAKSQYYKVGLYESALENLEKAQIRYDKAVENKKKDDIKWWGDELKKAQQNVEDTFNEMIAEYADRGCQTYDDCKALRADYSNYTYQKTVSTGGTYTVVGFYDEEFNELIDEELIIADDAQNSVMVDVISYMGKCYIYTEDESATKEAIKALPEARNTSISIKFTNPYDNVLSVYKAEKTEQFNGRIIVTATIFVVSMLILYFMMKASAVSRMGDLGVYRLIGISKGSIITLFAFENMIITSYTSLIGAILSTAVTHLISSIPSLGFEINYPWYAFLATVAFLYVVNVVVGVFPIRKILRLPPAQLATKYDI